MRYYITTYNYSGSFQLPNPDSLPGRCFREISAVELGSKEVHPLVHFTYLDSEANILRYLGLISRDWKQLIEENLYQGTLAINLDAFAHYYEQILQLNYLLRYCNIITALDTHYFAIAIHEPIIGIPDDGLQESFLKAISGNNRKNHSGIRYIDSENWHIFPDLKYFIPEENIYNYALMSISIRRSNL